MELSNTKLGDLGTLSGIDRPARGDVDLPAGKMITERFEIIGVIGRGGMGTVYEAHDHMREDVIALKFLLPELVSSDNARQRFLNEAKIAISLSHPHIVSVYDVVKYDDTCFLTMERLRGMSLRQRLQELAQSHASMPLAEAVGIVRDVGEALLYAHNSTIHRDVKPENIWLSPDGRAKLMDFGIARLKNQTRGLTKVSSVVGTAHYMAPEQSVGSGQIDHRADQYSLGVVFYEMLTGTLAIGKVKPVRAMRPHIGKAIDIAIETMMAGNMNDRYPSDAACVQALAALPVSEKPSHLGKVLGGIAALVLLGAGAAYYQHQMAVSTPAAAPVVQSAPPPKPAASAPPALSELIVLPESGKLTDIGFRPNPGAQATLPFTQLAKEEAQYREGKPSFTAGLLKDGKYLRGQTSFQIACVEFNATIEGTAHELRAVCKTGSPECVTMANGKFDGLTLTKFDVPQDKANANVKPESSGVMRAREVLIEMQKGRACVP